MKFFVVIALIASVQCVPYGGVVNTGHSAQFRSDDGYGNYEFGYNEDHATGGTFRKEKGGPGYQVGSYGLRDADGRMRIVHYIADAHGFRATITSNEPGVDTKQEPASTSMTGAYAPLAVSHTAIAPVAVAHQTYAQPATYHAEPAPIAVEHKTYSQPLDSVSVYPSQHSPIVAKAAYSPLLANKYSPALSEPLLSTHYEAPVLKSSYVPALTSAKAYSPVLSTGHYGDRLSLYGKPYQAYY